MRDYYQLPDNAAILDIGCAKGFMLHDFKELMPNLTIAGIGISEYVTEHAIETVKPFLRVGNAKGLPTHYYVCVQHPLYAEYIVVWKNHNSSSI